MLTLLSVLMTLPAVTLGSTAVESTGSPGLALLSSTPSTTNALISPLSISTCLAMVREGAAGRTRSQLDTAFGWSGDVAESYRALLTNLNTPSPSFNISSSNRIYVKDGFPLLDSFSDSLENNFAASSREVNFTEAGLVGSINAWVESQTNGKIKNLLSEIDPATVAILINTVYFKGQWRYPFFPASPDTFYLDSDLAIQAPTMLVEDEFSYYYNSDVEVVVLPYDGVDVSMVIVKPVERAALDSVERDLIGGDYSVVSSWVDKSQRIKLLLSMPKFSYEAKLENLVEVLTTHFGVTDLFDANEADLSGMSEVSGMAVSKIIHQAFIAVDENGTEAAAATAVEIQVTAIREEEEPKRVMINQPFLFLIRQGDTVLFAGRVVVPETTGDSYLATDFISSDATGYWPSASVGYFLIVSVGVLMAA